MMVGKPLLVLAASHANPLDSGQMMFHDAVWRFLLNIEFFLVISHCTEVTNLCN